MAVSTHRILIATDGSNSAQAAIATVVAFPWPESSEVRALVATQGWLSLDSDQSRNAAMTHAQIVADSARRALSSRWKKAEGITIEGPPVEAILAEATRFEATMIALGWRGHGTFQRVLSSSVAREVATRAACPLLIARQARSSLRRLVIGYDGEAYADRALDFVCSLERPHECEALLVSVVEPVSLPESASLLPGPLQAFAEREVAANNDERRRVSRQKLETAAARLAKGGWRATQELLSGDPLECLLGTVNAHNADLLVIGARRIGDLSVGLGSVAAGALNHCPVPLILVR